MLGTAALSTAVSHANPTPPVAESALDTALGSASASAGSAPPVSPRQQSGSRDKVVPSSPAGSVVVANGSVVVRAGGTHQQLSPHVGPQPAPALQQPPAPQRPMQPSCAVQRSAARTSSPLPCQAAHPSARSLSPVRFMPGEMLAGMAQVRLPSPLRGPSTAAPDPAGLASPFRAPLRAASPIRATSPYGRAQVTLDASLRNLDASQTSVVTNTLAGQGGLAASGATMPTSGGSSTAQRLVSGAYPAGTPCAGASQRIPPLTAPRGCPTAATSPSAAPRGGSSNAAALSGRSTLPAAQVTTAGPLPMMSHLGAAAGVPPAQVSAYSAAYPVQVAPFSSQWSGSPRQGLPQPSAARRLSR